jgi:hypothetical protein
MIFLPIYYTHYKKTSLLAATMSFLSPLLINQIVGNSRAQMTISGHMSLESLLMFGE